MNILEVYATIYYELWKQRNENLRRIKEVNLLCLKYCCRISLWNLSGWWIWNDRPSGDHDAIEWVSIGDLLSYELTEADVRDYQDDQRQSGSALNHQTDDKPSLAQHDDRLTDQQTLVEEEGVGQINSQNLTSEHLVEIYV